MRIRPKLEYSSPIWNSHTISQVKSLERVQHPAARFVKNDYRRNTNPADLITALGWPTLERRRIIKQATTFYKILNNIIEITPSMPTNLLSNPWTIHSLQVSYKCNGLFILFRAIRIWNTIPPTITNIKTQNVSRSYHGTPFHHTSSTAYKTQQRKRILWCGCGYRL